MGNHGIYGRKTMAGTVFAIGTSAYADTWQQPQNFSVLHKCSMGKNHPIYSGGSTGLTDFFGAIVSPSISQRNCCGVGNALPPDCAAIGNGFLTISGV